MGVGVAFNSKNIEVGLGVLAQRMSMAGIQAEIAVCGGANIALLHNGMRETGDIDYFKVWISEREEQFRRMVEEIGEDLYGNPEWLNDHVSELVSMPAIAVEGSETRTYGSGALVVHWSSPAAVLVLKAYAGREDDLEDARLLVRGTGISSPEGLFSATMAAIPETRSREDHVRKFCEEVFRG